MFQSSSKLSNQLKRKVNEQVGEFIFKFFSGWWYGSMWVHYATEERAEGVRTDGRPDSFATRNQQQHGEIIVGGNFRTETMIMSSSIFQTTDMAAKFWSINDGGTVNQFSPRTCKRNVAEL